MDVLAAAPELSRYAQLVGAADRLRVAQAVLDQLSSGFGEPPDPLVVSLACDELREAERAYLALRGRI